MKEEAVSSGKSQHQPISQTYGQLLRTTVAHAFPSEFTLQLETLEKLTQQRLATNLAGDAPTDETTLYQQAVKTGLEAMRSLQKQEEPMLLWLDLQNMPPANKAEQLAQTTAKVLARLSAERQRAVRLYLIGLTTDEMAELLGWEPGKAMLQLKRGLRKLRAALRAAGIEYESE